MVETNQETAASPAVPAPEYKDRSTGLVIFGIIQILLAGLALLVIPFLLFSVAMARKVPGGTMPLGTYLQSAATYVLAAGVLVTLGIGSIGAKRWARALTLVIAWVSLIVGIFSTVMITAFMPAGFMASMSAAGGPSGGMPSRGFVAVVLTFIIVCMAFFFIVVPLAFVLFYRRKDVEETCKRRDPVERWTDRSPLPVLAISLIFLVGGLYYLLIGFTTPLLPLFGRYVTGIPAAAGIFCVVAVDIVLAFWFFRLKPAAWWAAIIFLLLRGASGVITIARGNLLEAYSKLGWSQEQLQLMNANPAFRSGMMLWASLVFTAAFLGFIIWTKRYFKAAGPRPELHPELPSGGPVAF